METGRSAALGTRNGWRPLSPASQLLALLALGFYLVSTIISVPQAGVWAACSSPLKPITSQPVTRERVDKASEGMKQLSVAAGAGDAALAQAIRRQ